MPRRAFRETLVLATGQDLGDNPEAWKGWFKAHPILVWDKKLQRLMDKPMKPGESEVHYDAQGGIECPVILPVDRP